MYSLNASIGSLGVIIENILLNLMTIGFCTHSSFFCLFVMLWTKNHYWNWLFIENYSVGVYCTYGTFRFIGMSSWACETGGNKWNKVQNSEGVHQHYQGLKCSIQSTPLELGCFYILFPPVPQATLGVI